MSAAWWEDSLGELRFHWSGAYRINYLPGNDTWIAQRADDGATLTADSAFALREAIKADYAERPVPRKDSGKWLP